MSKYYTPDITEFHVGFEYEQRAEQLEWKKEIFKPEHFISRKWYTAQRVLSTSLGEYKYRVKYLDTEDIVSLGFELVDEPSDDGCITYRSTTGLEEYWISKVGKEVMILELVKDVVLFDGFIKNKSELKRILKQIGYENSSSTEL